MAKKSREEEQCGNWMDTYGDMVTLLLTFFVMLFSMSSVDAEKWQMLVEAFTNKGNETSQVVLAPEGEGDQPAENQGDGSTAEVDITNDLPTDLSELYEYIKAYAEMNNMTGSIQVEKGEGSVFIRFDDNIFFSPDSYYLLKSGFPVLDFLGNCLKNVEDQIVTININGHTADVLGVANYQINDRRLSAERAASVAIFLEEQKLLDPKKIIAIGYGKNYPVDTNETPEGRKANRRVDMIIVGKDAALSNEAIVTKVLENTFDSAVYPESGSGTDILLPQNESATGDAATQPATGETPAVPESQLEGDAATTPPTTTAPPAATPPPAASMPEAASSGAATTSAPTGQDASTNAGISSGNTAPKPSATPAPNNGQKPTAEDYVQQGLDPLIADMG